MGAEVRAFLFALDGHPRSVVLRGAAPLDGRVYRPVLGVLLLLLGIAAAAGVKILGRRIKARAAPPRQPALRQYAVRF